MKQHSKGLNQYLLGFLGLALILILVHVLLPFRLDLTEERRYSLHPASIAVLQEVESPIEVDILLTGKLPGGMRRLQRSIEETIRTFNAYSNKKISASYLDPLQLPQEVREDYIVGLAEYGINPTNLFVSEGAGQRSQMIFPGVVVRDELFEVGTLVLKGEKGMGPDEILNLSIENLEFELINSIRRLINKQKYAVGMIVGHGEMEEDDGFGVVEGLIEDYEVYKIPMEQAKSVQDLLTFEVLMIKGPKEAYTEREIYLLDQYLMHGGNLVFLIDQLAIDLKQAGGDGTVGMPFETGLEGLLFRYGIRINKDLIQDMNFGYYPVVAGTFGDQSQIVPLPWPFHIQAGLMAAHPITKGLDQISFRFVSSMDTVKADGVKKTPLIFSSEYSRRLSAPVRIAFEDMAEPPNVAQFNLQHLPLLYLLDGEFTSFFKNRFLPDGVDKEEFLESGNKGSVLVAGDGSLFKSLIDEKSGEPIPLGVDPFDEMGNANRELLQNVISFLIEPEGIMASRAKSFKIRPLNKVKVSQEKAYWQTLNVAFPVALVLIVGLAKIYWRKRRYTK
ncbi:gliding motility-associated ABC transporter substrate-binding protein GldG [Pararhodonellum marinum]|uniref:gliding motility-associated ABC transporter substrate-binding protein GldG n=1 Tax=Pararhodonellum marinum TaxID=2755358 RepID=UPI0018909782|nr:gliding motility-associated ABC transporter substrate-binding protein GldG [Pararhodonellum marinum]